MARRPISGAGLFVLGVAVLCASVLAVLVWVAIAQTAPHLRLVGPPPADLQGEAVAIETAAHQRLSGWYFRGAPGNGAILLLHGYRADKGSEIDRIRLLAATGFSVLAIDFGGHGDSYERWVSFGLLESEDAIAAVRWLRKMHPDERIGVIGTSMGGAAALVAGQTLGADALVLESVYATLPDAFANRLEIHVGRWARVLAPPMMSISALFTGVDPARLDLLVRSSAVTVPVLVAAGAEDRHATLAEGERIFRNITSPKEFWRVDGAGHVDLARFDPAGYRAHVVRFLTEQLRRSPQP